MKLQGILPFARYLLEQAVKPGDVAVDCTMGNGHDTAFLATLVGDSGHVYGFDIQAEAITATRERLTNEALLDRVTLIHDGHERLNEYLPIERQAQVAGAIFNLGYLPGGDKDIVTNPATTLAAVEQLLTFMPKGGLIVLVIYHGHEQGKIERNEVVAYAEGLNQKNAHVLRYEFVNQTNNPPFIIAIEKR
ncbi:class I SAM-dependent methyltransferase [Halalkalibacterium ligniniphilum]|uniref:class I SAM-dependent methyltransferase n=1 Tax=Halalkalibacterium ligniniphilum TaxID=1134413 RepID=UPI00034614AD|nr:class I SAM-dependent methyltransferase [Halalkalibacterium ligniniphilum]